MRKDLNMRKGKMIAQGAHASMMWLSHAFQPDYSYNNDGSYRRGRLTPAENQWLSGQFTKICVGVDSEEELRDICVPAHEAGLAVYVCMDSGLTEFHGEPTVTCAAIGPDYSELIDRFTGHLKLL